MDQGACLMAKKSILLIGGYAGAGKTELAKMVSRLLAWPLLDKDTLTRPLLERLSEALCGDRNDRQSARYVAELRPLEYQCLMDTAFEIVSVRSSIIAVAPFLLEFPDKKWIDQISERCSDLEAELMVVWVISDLPSMKSRLMSRGADRDRWKLAHWQEYGATVDTTLRPCYPYIEVDNHGSAQESLPYQAESIVNRLIESNEIEEERKA